MHFLAFVHAQTASAALAVLATLLPVGGGAWSRPYGPTGFGLEPDKSTSYEWTLCEVELEARVLEFLQNKRVRHMLL